MNRREPQLKTCKAQGCDNEFQQFSSLQVACSGDCALAIVREKKKKQYDKETKRLTREFKAKDKTYWKGCAIRACNAYIRARDGDTCISCGDHAGRLITAGHYRHASQPALRFHWANINAQCSRCNLYLSGNLAAYEKALIEKVGQDVVDYLNRDHPVYKYTLEDYKEITEYFREQKKLLENNEKELTLSATQV